MYRFIDRLFRDFAQYNIITCSGFHLYISYRYNIFKSDREPAAATSSIRLTRTREFRKSILLVCILFVTYICPVFTVCCVYLSLVFLHVFVFLPGVLKVAHETTILSVFQDFWNLAAGILVYIIICVYNVYTV